MALTREYLLDAFWRSSQVAKDRDPEVRRQLRPGSHHLGQFFVCQCHRLTKASSTRFRMRNVQHFHVSN